MKQINEMSKKEFIKFVNEAEESQRFEDSIRIIKPLFNVLDAKFIQEKPLIIKFVLDYDGAEIIAYYSKKGRHDEVSLNNPSIISQVLKKEIECFIFNYIENVKLYN